MAFDLKNNKQVNYEETATLTLKDENGVDMFDGDESKPLQITVYGSASKAYQRAVDTMMAKAAKRGKREATIAEKREESLDFLVALSVSTNNLDFDGEPITTPEQFKQLYAMESLKWVREQVNAFIGQDSNFLPTAKAN